MRKININKLREFYQKGTRCTINVVNSTFEIVSQKMFMNKSSKFIKYIFQA